HSENSFSSTRNALVRSYSFISSRPRLQPNFSLIWGSREVGQVTVPSISIPKRIFLIRQLHFEEEVLPVFSSRNILQLAYRSPSSAHQPLFLQELSGRFCLS